MCVCVCVCVCVVRVCAAPLYVCAQACHTLPPSLLRTCARTYTHRHTHAHTDTHTHTQTHTRTHRHVCVCMCQRCVRMLTSRLSRTHAHTHRHTHTRTHTHLGVRDTTPPRSWAEPHLVCYLCFVCVNANVHEGVRACSCMRARVNVRVNVCVDSKAEASP